MKDTHIARVLNQTRKIDYLNELVESKEINSFDELLLEAKAIAADGKTILSSYNHALECFKIETRRSI